VPGTAERGDRFGSSLTTGRAFLCQKGGGLAVGSPGEDVGRVRDAGSVTVIETSTIERCRPLALSQGHGLPGRARSGARLGSAVALQRDRDDLNEDVFDTLLVVTRNRVLSRNDDFGRPHTTTFELAGVSALATPLL
jgi:hypothetical protein